MRKPDSRILFFALTIMAIGLFYSCDNAFLDQPEDVLVPADKTTMFLSAERLPTPPAGMIYELWVVTAQGAGTSMGRFSYIESDTLIAFLDSTGAIRADSNKFVLDGDLFAYDLLAVTIEEADSASGAPIGPVMLGDRIVKLEDFHPRLNFAGDDFLFFATARYNLEAVSDNNRNSNDGRGVWFSSYRTALDHIPDTIGYTHEIVSIEVVPEIPIDTIIDTAIDSSNPVWDTTITTTYDTSTDTLNVDSLHGPFPVDTTSVTFFSERLMYGPDTLILGIDSFTHSGVVVKLKFERDDTPPFHKVTVVPSYTTVDNSSRDVTYDIFTQDEYLLPDYSVMGWKWEGWVVSQNIADTIPNRFTPPAWPHNTAQQNWFPGFDGRMVSTGTFGDITGMDDGDPFTYALFAGVRELYDSSGWDPIVDTGMIDTIQDTIFKRPRYPGEDFLNKTAMDSAWGTGSDDIKLIGPAGPTTVFISLVPDNFRSDTTNFPLIAFSGQYFTVGVNDMFNLTGSVEGDRSRGFPEIKVSYIRE